MKWFIIILMVCFFVVTSCYSSKKIAKPILPSTVDNGCLYYRDKIDQAILFNEYDRFLKLLKDSKCIHSLSSLFKIGPNAVFLQLETNLGTMIFLLPPSSGSDNKDMYIQDMKNDLRYQITNVDDIRWLINIRKLFNANKE